MSKQKAVSANGFNEYGGVSYVNRCGETKTLSAQIVNTSLPEEGENQFVVDPAFAPIEAGTGTTTLVAGVDGLQISVMSYVMIASSATTVQIISSGATNTDITGPMVIAANGDVSANDNEIIFRTQPGDDLVVTNSAGSLAGHIAYKIG